MESQEVKLTNDRLGGSTVTEGDAVRPLQPGEDGAWDAFVRRHPLGSPYHLSSWRLAIERAFPHIRGSALVATAPGSDTILAGLPIYEVRSWLLGPRLVSVPFATYGDPLLQGPEQLRRFLPVIRLWMRRAGMRRFELKTWRQHPDALGDGFRITRRYLHHFLPLDQDRQALLRNCSATSVRHMIAKARKHGIRIVEQSGAAALDVFYRIHVETRGRLGLPALPRSFFASLTDPAHGNPASVHFALRSDAPVATALALRFRDMLSIEYAGDLPTDRRTGAGQLLYWELICHAQLHGCRWISMGRTGFDNPGLRSYKGHWNAREEELRTQILAPVSLPSDQPGPGPAIMRRIARRALAALPRRVAVWLGRFCYRHLG